MNGSTRRVYTVGHSTRPIEKFIDILKSFQISHLVDVRTIPRSRRNPQFNKENLPGVLDAASIAYTHSAGLGGLRKPRTGSENMAWRNDSFRGYADYMGTPEFEENLASLIELAENEPAVAIMCAESLPWRCHRSLIADALTVRGFEVIDLLDEGKSQAHSLTPFAKVDGLRVTYPGESDS
jgi:uncharacterized protein (DUF488 family)